MLALLVALQAVTKPLGQLVTGSCVNGVLALTVLLVGMSGGITVALISPVFAFLFGIAPNLVTVVPIMLGNVCFVVLLRCIAGKRRRFSWRQPIWCFAVQVQRPLASCVQLVCPPLWCLLPMWQKTISITML